MDRDRLKEVHKTDTTESRVNEDFVDWLKNKGPTWLLVVLVALTAYLGFVRWQSSRQSQHVQAWRALSEAESSTFPATLVSVADDYPDVDAIAILARLQAAQLHLQSVLTGRAAGVEPTEEPQPMTEDEREQTLARADRLYQEVLDADDGTMHMALHAINAYNGRGAVAEARGDLDAAKQHYLAAADRADAAYPALAEQSRLRAEGQSINTAVTLPAEDDVATPGDDAETPQSATINPALRDLLLPLP